MLGLINQLFRFFKAYRKFWMAPIIFFLLIVGGLIVVIQGSAFAPFIYALF
jgi:uncharacterized ion transporter superfamily protein YfcC